MAFAHLHVHSQYSFLDGAVKTGALPKLAKKAGMTAVAITDRQNMYGAVEFQKACQKEGIKPIFGCEVSVVSDRTDPADKRSTMLLLLAETDAGYKNLIACVSHSWLEGWQNDVPRVDRALVAEYAEGLIGLSGGLGGDVAQAILRREPEEAAQLAAGWADIFGKENFFLQVEDLGFKENRRVNETLANIGADLGIGVVATNYVHYAAQEDARPQAALMCIGLSKSYATLAGAIPDGLWFKPESEMRSAFDWLPEAVDNAGAVADRCNATIELGKTYLPNYEVPEGEDLVSFLRKVTHEGLEERFQEIEARGETYDRAVYVDRLDVELGIIIAMNFPGYFLIVWDFIKEAGKMGVPVGPGRGSGAGSLVAFSLRITDIDPLPYGLLFERFLNPERVSMPDFDIDFCMNKRDLVIKYVSEKYGRHNVGQIITYGTLKAKAALRDIGRVLDLTFGEVDRIAKLVPDELGITLKDALKKEPRFQELFAEDPRYRELYDTAVRLEGLCRHAGIHAAGIVIGEEVLWKYVPICRGANGEIVTQYAKEEVEEAGLVKFDFLGLKTLTVIDHAVRIINESKPAGEAPFVLRQVPMYDEKVFELLSSGETTGVFQLESSGFQELMKSLKPNCFEDIVAAVALYRPGPLQSGMVDDFVARKHGLMEVEYPHPALADVLQETYGTIVYQEQVMSIARIIAGYSLGGADLLRRAMGKKKASVMAAQKLVFIEGAAKTGLADADKAEAIFDLMAHFAGYGFNKSHSAAYGLISYQTAYLKAHYPVEFMAALLTADGDNTDKVVRYIADARSNGIVVRPPDVNVSLKDFSVDSGGIRFGLGAIKQVGESAVDSIIEMRENGAYGTLFEMMERVDTRRVNRRVLEAMIKSGACDCFGPERHILFNNIERALERGTRMQRDREVGQTSLFAMFDAMPKAGAKKADANYDTSGEPWLDRTRLAFEKDAIGFYVSGHPLDSYKAEVGRYATRTTATLSQTGFREEVALSCVVAAKRERPLRSGNGRMAFATLEDLHGQVEALFFSAAFEESEDALNSGDPLLVYGSVKLEGDGEHKTPKLRANRAVRLADIRAERTTKVAFRIDTSVVDADAVHQLAALCRQHEGTCSIVVLITVPGSGRARIDVQSTVKVEPSEELIAAAERLIGRGMVSLA